MSGYNASKNQETRIFLTQTFIFKSIFVELNSYFSYVWIVFFHLEIWILGEFMVVKFAFYSVFLRFIEDFKYL